MKDYLPVSTIKSYFSRRAKKIRSGQLKLGDTQDDEADDIVFEDVDNDQDEEIEDDDDDNDDENDRDEKNEDVDNEIEREKATTVIQHLVNSVPNLEIDDWVAVAFPRGWYPGQFVRYDDELKEVFVNFLERTSSNSKNFIWPALNSKEEDKSWVDEGIEVFHNFLT